MPEATRQDHLYGGQALIEGVMMRGRDVWAIAVRRPDRTIHRESHTIDSIVNRHPFLGKPGFRGVIALGQALSLGYKALTISANQANEEDEQLGKGGMAIAMTMAILLFIVVFLAGPAALFGWAEKAFLGSGFVANLLEGLFRFGLLIVYVAGIGMMKDVRRVYQYHGAEHKTIAAYEHEEPLDVEHVDRFSTVHRRCGTNFLGIVFLIAIIAFSFLPPLPIAGRILSRVVAIPVIAAVAYELLRLGAKYPTSIVMRVLTAPGMWMQKITTRPPEPEMIDVAIASFETVLEREAAEAASAKADPGTGGTENEAASAP